MEYIFMFLLTIWMSSVEKCLFRSSTYCFFLLDHLFLWYWAVYSSNLFRKLIPCRSVASFANISSCFIGHHVVFFMVSFVLQKLLNFIKIHLFIFAFVSIVSRTHIPKNVALIYVKECLPMFSSRIFMVCRLTLRS